MRCFFCDCSSKSNINNLYNYNVCDSCERTLGLFKDHTIRKSIASYEKKREEVPENPSYRQEVDYRLENGEKSYIKARLKLLHIQARLKAMSKQD